ncbi:MAG: hypothetical protein HYV97_03920 [Bdellovibrio sp.]|nr:hypothetical protein [Bdellovibrio sp.]
MRQLNGHHDEPLKGNRQGPSSLCDLEKGRKIPSPSRAASIAETLGVSENLWIEVALQDQLREQGIDLKVSVA